MHFPLSVLTHLVQPLVQFLPLSAFMPVHVPVEPLTSHLWHVVQLLLQQ
jgi:hypothetical protein